MTGGTDQAEKRQRAGGHDPSVDSREVARFAALAREWWNPDGAMAQLHRLNPVRLAYIRDRLAAHFDLDPLSPRPLEGLDIVDVGCGGGLLCEPLARLGARVTGIDAAAEGVRAAAAHGDEMGLDIDYRASTAAELAATGARFDAVLCFEVIEHVADMEAFVADCCRLVKPGGAMAMATLNRTPKSFLFAIIGAERVLRWLPAGTHDWHKFVRPSELARALGTGGMTLDDVTGAGFDLVQDEWRETRDVSVNYMAFASFRLTS